MLPHPVLVNSPKHLPPTAQAPSLGPAAGPTAVQALPVWHQEEVTNPELKARTHNRTPRDNAPVLCNRSGRVPLRVGGRPLGGPRGSPKPLEELP